jgi:hypothetical protein
MFVAMVKKIEYLEGNNIFTNKTAFTPARHGECCGLYHSLL